MINIISIGIALILLAPAPLEPLGTITDRQPTFKWSGYAHTLVIDDSEKLDNPEYFELKNDFKLEKQLDFTTYYYKLIGNKASKTSSFTVDSLIQVETTEENNQLLIKNEGNTHIKAVMPTGFAIIDQNQAKSFPKQAIEIKEP